MRRRHLLLFAGFVVVALFGYWLARTAAQRPLQAANERAEPNRPPVRRTVEDDAAPRFRKGTRLPTAFRDEAAAEEGAFQGQRVIAFKDRAALEDFLKRAGDKVRIMGRLDALNALRIGFQDYADLASLLNGDEEMSFVYPVDIPAPGDGAAQAGAVALGPRLLEWLGITEDNSAWGKGVRIAILDTGVTANSALSSKISYLNLVALPLDLTAQNGHGTAVASMIVGRDALTPGVAPDADIVSIRIADDQGRSDSYILAQGIIAAVDAGAKLINISMGSFGDSPLVRSAIAYAHESGALIVAAAGNNGLDRVSFPAANAGVIAVGAVDAMGNHLDFSNTGSQVAISAPGYGVNAAWANDEAASVSGTSFSAPIVLGTIAAVKSWPGNESLTMEQAANLVFTYLNDGGAAGADPALGGGMPDLGRVKNGTTPGIYDAALASQRVLPPDSGNPYGQVEILVQNRGTETLINTGVQISTPSGLVRSNITTLPVGGVYVMHVPLPAPSTDTMRYDSRVILSGGLQDAKPSNDRRADTYVPAVKN